MKKMRKKRHPYTRGLLFLISIISLSGMGVSYAYWTSQLDLITRVSTGYLGVNFEDAVGSEELRISFDKDKSVLYIEGVAQEKVTELITETEEATIISAEYSDYEGYFGFNFEDNGSIPAKLTEKKINKDDNLVLEESSDGLDERMYIRAGEGVYDFEIDLHFTN